MVDAYLYWKALNDMRVQDPSNIDATPPPFPFKSSDTHPAPSLGPEGSPPAPSAPSDTQYDFTMPVIDIFTLKTRARIRPLPGTPSGAAALVMNGFVGVTPVNPSLAYSIETLELYRRLRLRKPSFSVEAFSKVLCDYYVVRL